MYGIEPSSELWQGIRTSHFALRRYHSSDADELMPTRRLDDRIRELCARITEASNGELEGVLQELLGAVHEKVERLRNLAVRQLVGGKTPKDRRISSP